MRVARRASPAVPPYLPIRARKRADLPMSVSHELRLAYYGDDFTGSTDALEVLSRAGLRTMLFVEPPTPEQLAKLGRVDAIGIAGATRSLAPDAMAAHLRTVFP